MPDTRSGDIERMLDEREIRQVLAKYCRAVGRMDLDLLKSLYLDTATVDAGSPADGDIAGYLAYIASGIEPGIAKVPIALGQTLFDFDGKAAWSETYYHAAHEKDADGGDCARIVLRALPRSVRATRRTLAHRPSQDRLRLGARGCFAAGSCGPPQRGWPTLGRRSDVRIHATLAADRPVGMYTAQRTRR